MNLMDGCVEMEMDGKVFRRVSSAELQKFNFWSLVFKSTVQHQQTDGKSVLQPANKRKQVTDQTTIGNGSQRLNSKTL